MQMGENEGCKWLYLQVLQTLLNLSLLLVQLLVPVLQIGLTAGEAGFTIFNSLLLPADGLSCSLCLLHSDIACTEQGTDQTFGCTHCPCKICRDQAYAFLLAVMTQLPSDVMPPLVQKP